VTIFKIKLIIVESQEDESGNADMLYAQTQAYAGEDEGGRYCVV
jgi:hypothetical protein